jgi:hypothetical protein
MDRAHLWWGKTDAIWRESDKSWEFPSGAKITFGYLENLRDLDRYQSAEYHYIGLDEASQFKPVLIQSIMARIRRLKTGFPSKFPLRARLTTNPGGVAHKWLMQYFGIPKWAETRKITEPVVVRDERGGVKRVFLPAHAEDNPGLDVDDYRLSLAELPELRRKQLQDGLWVEDNTLLCYPSIAAASIEHYLPSGYDWRYVLGLDFGASGNSAMSIVSFCDNLQETYLVRSQIVNANGPTDIAELIKRLDQTYHFARIVADHGGLGKGYIDELRKRHSIPIVNAEKTNKRGYIELFDDAMTCGTLRLVGSTTEEFQDEALALIWDDERKLEEASGLPNHCCDSALYAWREAKHYTYTPIVKKPELDEMQAITERNLIKRRRDISRYGVVIPTALR